MNKIDNFFVCLNLQSLKSRHCWIFYTIFSPSPLAFSSLLKFALRFLEDEKHSFMMKGNLAPGSWKKFIRNGGEERESVLESSRSLQLTQLNSSPLLSIAVWLHFMIASTAWAMDGNSTNPDDERSVLSGNMRIADGATSFFAKMSNNWSSARLGGVLKKWRI